MLPIYPARELPIPGVTANSILDLVTCPDKQLTDKQNLIETIKNSNFEVLLTLGAGDMCEMLPQICAEINR